MLVLINLNLQQVLQTPTPDMITCFQMREAIGYQLTGAPGYYPPGIQAVCVDISHMQEEEDVPTS